MMYNLSDVTINISDAEGFGLSTFESLMCETPIIVTMTGGLQEQVTYTEKVSKDIMEKRNIPFNKFYKLFNIISLSLS